MRSLLLAGACAWLAAAPPDAGTPDRSAPGARAPARPAAGAGVPPRARADAGTALPAGDASPIRRVAPDAQANAREDTDEVVVRRVPELQQKLEACAPLALEGCEGKSCHGCLTVLIAAGPKGLTFTLDRQRPALKYEEAEKCLRTYAGPRPVLKKGQHLRVPVCL